VSNWYFFAINSLYQFKVESLQSLVGANIETRFEDGVYGLITRQRASRLLSSRLSFAFAEMLFGAGNELRNQASVLSTSVRIARADDPVGI
jgi:hypothetical protein